MKPSRWLFFGLALFYSATLHFAESDAKTWGTHPIAETMVVAAEPDDPYSPLAREIAQAEGRILQPTLRAALESAPDFVLWVVAPNRLSDAAMVEAGRLLRRQSMRSALGIITGNTMEQARLLYRAGSLRSAGKTAASGHSAIVASAYPTLGLEQGFIKDEQSGFRQALTVESLQAALANAIVAQYSGHGSGRSWHLGKNLSFTARHVPALPPLSVAAMSCQTLRPWLSDSLAMAFVGQGAAAYAGFVFSPIDGYFMGERAHAPFLHTWPGFPVGRMVQFQAAQTLFSFARLPFYFLLGDPRRALHTDAPYTLEQDFVRDGLRTLGYRNAPPGMLPIRIPGGADYGFVELPSKASRADFDLFYNRDLQTLNLGEDKYVLFEQTGGDFVLTLSRRPPWMRWISLTVLDALDTGLVFNQDYGGAEIMLGIGILGSLCILVHSRKKRRPLRPLGRALLGGMLLAGLATTYILLRLDDLRVIDKPVNFSWWTPPAILLLEAAALYMFYTAQKRRGRVAGWALALSPFWLPALFLSVIYAAMNVFALLQAGGAIYGYRMACLPLAAMVPAIPCVWLLFRWRPRPAPDGTCSP